MGVNHLGDAGLKQEIQRLWTEVHRVGRATLQHGSIGNAGIRFYDAGSATFEGGGGVFILDGGSLTGAGGGVLDWTGTVYLRGPTGVQGNFSTSGSTRLAGPVTLDNNLTLGTGRIVVGPLLIDKNGSYGGRVVSTSTLLLDASSAVILGAPATVQGGLTAVGLITGTALQSLSNITALGNITAVGDIGGGSKSFWIDHPTKPGKQLRHGSLEGPEHGVFYRGVVEFDADGEAVFDLPEYFTALVLVDDEPTVQVTPIGRPFMVGAERVAGGAVTVYGAAGREAHITVTAAREHFDVEPDKTELEPIASDWTPPVEDDDEEE
ncbi:MAG: hypothetical protein P0Y60_14445 [Candidatus Microbacterium colombiense]|nr:MAG: hypothetical protein P0Y60_14445 [Microbacterium sp.]